jgi:hypothetical protein
MVLEAAGGQSVVLKPEVKLTTAMSSTRCS